MSRDINKLMKTLVGTPKQEMNCCTATANQATKQYQMSPEMLEKMKAQIQKHLDQKAMWGGAVNTPFIPYIGSIDV